MSVSLPSPSPSRSSSVSSEASSSPLPEKPFDQVVRENVYWLGTGISILAVITGIALLAFGHKEAGGTLLAGGIVGTSGFGFCAAGFHKEWIQRAKAQYAKQNWQQNPVRHQEQNPRSQGKE